MRAATARVTSFELPRERRRRAQPAAASNAATDDDARYVSEDAEQAVLSAMLMEPDAILRAREIVDETMFSGQSHPRIYRAMLSLCERGDAVDPLTLIAELTRRGDLEASGGKDYIRSWSDAVPSAANVEYHAKIVREKWERRQLRHFGEQLKRESAEAISPSDVLSAHREVLASLSFGTTTDKSSAFLPLAALLERPELLIPPARVVAKVAFKGRGTVVVSPDKGGKSTLLGNAGSE